MICLNMFTEKYDMIVSNPPYIRTEEISSLEDEVKLHDPWIALDGKEDGLYFYRMIVTESITISETGGYVSCSRLVMTRAKRCIRSL